MSPAEAVKIQKEIAQKIKLYDDFSSVSFIGGMDVSCSRFDPEKKVYAAVVVLSFPELEVVEEAFASGLPSFSYIPGLLGFREAPVLLEAFNKLTRKPDLLMVDGHGIAHPRRCGIATHIGVLLDLPSIGVAKSVLVGHPALPLLKEKGALTPLVWKEKEIGMFFQTCERAHPLIISAGHKISLPKALKWVTATLRGYRLPEPTRQAHLACNKFRRQEQRISLSTP